MKYFLAAVLLLNSSFAMADGSSLPLWRGGTHAEFDSVIALYNQSGERFRIEGVCKSTCPMLLGIRNVCVDRNASLQFHGAHNPSGQITEYLNHHLRIHFNAKLQTYLRANHILDTLAFTGISGTDLIDKFGYRECPRK
jgi:hypothetical protein